MVLSMIAGLCRNARPAKDMKNDSPSSFSYVPFEKVSDVRLQITDFNDSGSLFLSDTRERKKHLPGAQCCYAANVLVSAQWQQDARNFHRYVVTTFKNTENAVHIFIVEHTKSFVAPKKRKKIICCIYVLTDHSVWYSNTSDQEQNNIFYQHVKYVGTKSCEIKPLKLYKWNPHYRFILTFTSQFSVMDLVYSESHRTFPWYYSNTRFAMANRWVKLLRPFFLASMKLKSIGLQLCAFLHYDKHRSWAGNFPTTTSSLKDHTLSQSA